MPGNGYVRPPRFSIGVTMPEWNQDDDTWYRGYKIHKLFTGTDRRGTCIYQYSVEDFPTVFTSLALACEEVDYLINKNNRKRTAV